MTDKMYSFYEIAAELDKEDKIRVEIDGKFVLLVDENRNPPRKFNNFRKKRQKYFEEILVKAKIQFFFDIWKAELEDTIKRAADKRDMVVISLYRLEVF